MFYFTKVEKLRILARMKGKVPLAPPTMASGGSKLNYLFQNPLGGRLFFFSHRQPADLLMNFPDISHDKTSPLIPSQG